MAHANPAAAVSSVRAAAAVRKTRSRTTLLMTLAAMAGLLAGVLGTRAMFGSSARPPVPAVHQAQPARPGHPVRSGSLVQLDQLGEPGGWQREPHTVLLAVTRPAARNLAWAGNAALNWAETQRGAPYSWGSTGPYWSGYDCSGLVWRAFARLGIVLPRTTYGMLSSPRLHRTWTPHRGDLAFYGSGHVEFVTVWWHVTFGAHTWGDPVSWAHYDPAWGWAPTMFFEVF